MTFLEIMSSPILYILVGLGILYILVFCGITLARSYRHGLAIGLTKAQLRTAITSSSIYSLVPSISIVVGLISLSTVIGVPWAWFRLSVVGAVTYELISAEMTATGAGFPDMAALGASAEGASLVGTVMFVMSIGILAGVIAILLFGPRIMKGVSGLRSKHGAWGALMTGVLSMAIIEAFLPLQLVKGPVYIAVVITSVVVTVLQLFLIKLTGWKWWNNFIMAVTLLVGMASSLLWTNLLG